MVSCLEVNRELIILSELLYNANVLPLQWPVQLTKTVHKAQSGLLFVFNGFSRLMIYLYVCVCYVLFYLGQLSYFPSCFGAGVTR